MGDDYSPAINAAESGLRAAEPINDLDQRGETRDIGAFEFIAPEPEQSSFFVVPTANGKSVIYEL